MLGIIAGSIKNNFLVFLPFYTLFFTHITSKLLNLLPIIFVSVAKKMKEHFKNKHNVGIIYRLSKLFQGMGLYF